MRTATPKRAGMRHTSAEGLARTQPCQVDDVVQGADLVQAQVTASAGTCQVDRWSLTGVAPNEDQRREHRDLHVRPAVGLRDSFEGAFRGADRVTRRAQRVPELRQERNLQNIAGQGGTTLPALAVGARGRVCVAAALWRQMSRRWVRSSA